MVAKKAPIFLMSMTKPVEDPLDVFLAFFFFFYFLSLYRQNCPNYFSNCTLGRDYSSPKGLAFYMLQTWIHLLHWKSVKFQTHASIPGVHSAHRKCVRQWLLNLHVCQKGQGRGRTVNWKQEAGDGAKIKSKGYVKMKMATCGLSPISLGMETLYGNPGILVLLINQILTDFRYYCFQISKSTGQGKPY